MTADQASRKAADQRSNLTGAAKLPDYATNGTEYIASGTSIFDPVLCEVLYTWFSRPGAHVLDPFAGGSVRGIVAAMLGRDYSGVDLSAPQVEANRQQAETICVGPALVGGKPVAQPRWHVGDSRTICAEWPQDGTVYDLILTCPPYFDLEVYSDNLADLSQADDLDAFTAGMAEILQAAVDRLADDRFVVIVMGEARDKSGALYGLIPATIEAARAADLTYVNEIILLTMIGSLALRVVKPFTTSRKIGRTHQTVLVFAKGSPKAAADWCGPVDVADLSAMGAESDPPA